MKYIIGKEKRRSLQARKSETVKTNAVGRKHGIQTPVHNAMNARNCEKRMKKRIALCHAEMISFLLISDKQSIISMITYQICYEFLQIFQLSVRILKIFEVIL